MPPKKKDSWWAETNQMQREWQSTCHFKPNSRHRLGLRINVQDKQPPGQLRLQSRHRLGLRINVQDKQPPGPLRLSMRHRLRLRINIQDKQPLGQLTLQSRHRLRLKLMCKTGSLQGSMLSTLRRWSILIQVQVHFAMPNIVIHTKP